MGYFFQKAATKEGLSTYKVVMDGESINICMIKLLSLNIKSRIIGTQI